MPSNYSGNAGNVAAHENPTITVPSDGDARAATSIVGPLDMLADYVAFLQANATLHSDNPALLGDGAVMGSYIHCKSSNISTQSTLALPVAANVGLYIIGCDTSSGYPFYFDLPASGPWPGVGSLYIIQMEAGGASMFLVSPPGGNNSIGGIVALAINSAGDQVEFNASGALQYRLYYAGLNGSGGGSWFIG